MNVEKERKADPSPHLPALGHSKGKQKCQQELFNENILYLSWRRWRLKRVRWNRTESLLKFCPEKEKQSN